MLVADLGGPTMFARIGVLRALNRGHVRAFNPSRKDPHWGRSLESAMHKTTTFEHGGKVYEVRAIPTLNGWKVRIFVEGIPANAVTYSVDSEVYQDVALDGVPEDLVAGLMETAERDFLRGLAQEPDHR